MLRKHAPIARQKVRKLVEGRIVFTPDRDARRYTFLAPGTLANFFSGIVCPTSGGVPNASELEPDSLWLHQVEELRPVA